MTLLKQHTITLVNEGVTLRPMTEDDWGVIYRWWHDPDIAYYADAQVNPEHYTLAVLRYILRTISARHSASSSSSTADPSATAGSRR